MYYFSPRRLSLASIINSTIMMMMTANLLRRQRMTTTATTVTSFTDRACRSSCFHSMTAVLTRKRSSTTRASKWAVVRPALTRPMDTSAFLVTEAGRSLNRISKTFDSTLQHYQHQQVSWNNRFRYNTLLKSMQLQRHQCRMLSTVTGDASSSPPNMIIPRAAVSVAVRVQCDIQKDDDDDDINAASDSHEIDNVKRLTFYLLIQRGTEPSKGMWSLPGGKIEYPETTFQAAQRELYEETQWSTNTDKNKDANTDDLLQWYNETVLTTDAIGDGYHYVIAHYFAKYPNISIPMDPVLHSTKMATGSSTTFDETMEGYITNIRQQYLPIVLASDDAADAQWYTMKEIYDMEINLATTTCGVSRVLQRMEMCDRANLLD